MANAIELALMSANVYDFRRLNSNRVGVSDGWTRLNYIPDDPESGFSAGVFQRGSEIVIAYTGYKNHQQGALRAALDAYLQASGPQTLDGSASSAITANGLPATHSASINPSPAARYGSATLAARQTAFDHLLNLWVGVEGLSAEPRFGGMSLRHAAIMEQVYGNGFQNADAEQAGVWNVAYRRLTEGIYASLAAQTHLKDDYALIEWRAQVNINQEIGHLGAVTAVFKQRLADAIAVDAAVAAGAQVGYRCKGVMRHRRCAKMLMNHRRFQPWRSSGQGQFHRMPSGQETHE